MAMCFGRCFEKSPVLGHGTQIRLQHVSTGKFLQADRKSRKICLVDNQGVWEIFKIWRPTRSLDGLAVSTYLKVYDNHVVQACNGGGTILECRAENLEEWEHFTIISRPGTNPKSLEQQVHIRVHNGHYLQVENGNLLANLAGEPGWATSSSLFKMIIVAHKLEDVQI